MVSRVSFPPISLPSSYWDPQGEVYTSFLPSLKLKRRSEQVPEIRSGQVRSLSFCEQTATLYQSLVAHPVMPPKEETLGLQIQPISSPQQFCSWSQGPSVPHPQSSVSGIEVDVRWGLKRAGGGEGVGTPNDDPLPRGRAVS